MNEAPAPKHAQPDQSERGLVLRVSALYGTIIVVVALVFWPVGIENQWFGYLAQFVLMVAASLVIRYERRRQDGVNS